MIPYVGLTIALVAPFAIGGLSSSAFWPPSSTFGSGECEDQNVAGDDASQP